MVAILVLAALLGAGLYFFKHRGLNDDFEVLRGEASDYAFRVDLNTAPWEEIALLPGIGEHKARAIVEYREAHGPFTSTEDLRKVPGIGEKTAAAIAPYASP